ncbi:MAG: hypothetical protein ACJ75H_20735 [Thermoanaerobaculia bacterium]
MLGNSARFSMRVAVALLGLFVVGCAAKDYRQIVVVDGDKTEVVTWGHAPEKEQNPAVWANGRTLVFRSDSSVPGAPAHAVGKAGRVYRVTEANQMEEVGEFPLTMPNDTLAYQYGR